MHTFIVLIATAIPSAPIPASPPQVPAGPVVTVNETIPPITIGGPTVQPRPVNVPPNATASRAAGSGGSAFAMANRKRAGRGLAPFTYDPRLQRSVNSKALAQARAQAVYHPGGGMPGASGEGVGGSGSASDFRTCYLYATHKTAAAATVRGSNGMYYHALQVSGPGVDPDGGGRVRRLFRRFRR